MDRQRHDDNVQGNRLIGSAVTVCWLDVNGEQLRENADLSEVSAKGAVLEMATCPDSGVKLSIMDLLRNRTGTARAVHGRKAGKIVWVLIEDLRWDENSDGQA